MGMNSRALDAIGEVSTEELRPQNMPEVHRVYEPPRESNSGSMKKLPFAYQPNQPASCDEKMEIEVEKYEEEDFKEEPSRNLENSDLMTPNLTPIQNENYRQIM
mmetsp:Transcript_1709/g.2218  ORF Transcript_1709/g.2218 Transcript_1709/m.2218 type:complete len:104 (-) Transcript_1709:310-621(-)|eukprot:CAMPEP_0170512108 /NCGR_PEP_ID=MMETSP0208-20121228/66667_1 /TAXON_ID=197538 /ORGANISM="Strombidium inclinatum, Strain S3" /LENGTH=103 /DNA_ID=CAMNT_0010795703 /DNA_START=1876 /DNA_END=2187 /DNA_ORIENTATION=+